MSPEIKPPFKAEEIKPPFKAEERIFVFPPGQLLTKDQGQSGEFSRENTYIRLRGYCEFQLELMKAGLSPNLATVFVQVLWRAGPYLERNVSVSSLANDMGRPRETVSRAVTTLQEIGIVQRRGEPSKLSRWEFPIFQEVMTRVRTWVERKRAERKQAGT